MADLKPVIVSQSKSTENNGDAPHKRPKLTKSLPTERIKLDRQMQILRAFAALSGPTAKAVLHSDVAEMTGMKASTVYITLPFFVSVQLLQKSETGYTPSSEVINLQRAHDWNAETAPQKLSPALRRTWFADELLPKLAFGPMPETLAIQKLAESIGASPEHEPQLQVLLDYLNIAGLLERSAGVLRKAPTSPTETIEAEAAPTTNTAESLGTKEAPRTNVKTTFSQNPAGSVDFHINVQVDMGEFASWQPERISAFFSGLAQVLAAKADVERKS